ncbi:MAG TPA: hypothetical protein VGE52_01200 [Pirellulales bacterium]
MCCLIKPGVAVCKVDDEANNPASRMVVVGVDASGQLALCVTATDGAPAVIALSKLKLCAASVRPAAAPTTYSR